MFNFPRFGVLGSGSSANAYVFECSGFSFLLDNGFALGEFQNRMNRLDFDPDRLAFIFLSHAHSDHFKGVEALALKWNIPVVTHRDMPLERYCKKGCLHRLDIIPGRNYDYGDLTFRCFRTSHDFPFSVSFHYRMPGMNVTIITDTGQLSREMEKLALDSDYLFLESNYSPRMLISGSYPPFLKKRILSSRGHLSNLDAAAFMNRLSSKPGRLKKVFLCHVSDNNNSPEKIHEEWAAAYRGKIPYRICPKNECLSQQMLLAEQEYALSV